MLKDKSKVQTSIDTFIKESGCAFDLNEFERKAQELEINNPGQGYKLAYKEALRDICKQLFDQSKTKEDVLDLDYAYSYFDDVMNKYKKSCQEENIDLNIKKNFKEDTFENDLKYFEFTQKTIYSLASPMAVNYDKYQKGELTADEMIRFTRSKIDKDKYFEREDAEKIASYARIMQTVNETRPFRWKVAHLFTHIKEKFQIREMKKALKENSLISRDVLEASAGKETDYVKREKREINERLVNERHQEIQPLDMEKDAVDLTSLPKRIQMEIDLDEPTTEYSPRIEDKTVQVKNNVINK